MKGIKKSCDIQPQCQNNLMNEQVQQQQNGQKSKKIGPIFKNHTNQAKVMCILLVEKSIDFYGKEKIKKELTKYGKLIA